MGGIGRAVALAGGLVTAATLTGCSQGEDGLKPDQHLDVIGDDAWIVTGGEEQSRQVACPALRTALEDQFEGHTE